MSVDDADLDPVVRAACAGDDEAFRQLYRAVQPGLLRYLRALVGQDAEDVASEAWLQIARDIRTFRGEGAGFRAWAATIARHRALDHLRRLSRRPVEGGDAQLLHHVPDPADTAGLVVEALDTRAAVALIARLPREQAEAVLLRVVVGLDRATAEALLRGDPAVRRDAGRLGDVLAASAAPGHPGELTGLPAALAAYQAAGSDPVNDQRRTSVIRTWLTKVLTVKAAVVLALTAAGGAALAATTGTLPDPLNHGSTVSASHRPDHPSASPHSSPGPHGSADPSPNLVGLCHAYTAGAGSDHGKALDNPAFTALVTAAGGRDRVDVFCQDMLASPADASHPGPSDHPGGKPSQHPSPTHPTH